MRTVTGLAGGGILTQLPCLRDLLACHVLFDLVDLLDERLPELLERRGPFFFAARDRIQLVFHRGGEAVLDVAVEVLREEAVDDLADVGRHEAPAVHFHVLAVLERRDDRGIGRGTADAVLLERLHERGLAVARRRLGEVLQGGERGEAHGVALVHRRQHVIGIVHLGVIAAFLVDGHVAGLHERRAIGAQQVTLRPIGARQHVDRHGVEQRMAHLRGDRALPDQGIKAIQVVFDLAFLDVLPWAVMAAEVGRMASCASWAFFDLVL